MNNTHKNWNDVYNITRAHVWRQLAGDFIGIIAFKLSVQFWQHIQGQVDGQVTVHLREKVREYARRPTNG